MTKIKNNFWAEFTKETGGKFIEGYSWHSDKTEIEYNNWKIIFDNYTLWSGKHCMEMTRVIVPFISIDNFKFEIYRNSFVRKVENLFGAQDVEIGRTDFDKAFVIKANNEFKIKTLLQNQKIRRLIEIHKDINILISDQKGVWDEKLPENEFELSFYADGQIRDFECLKSLLDLFKEMIDSLSQMKSIENIKAYR